MKIITHLTAKEHMNIVVTPDLKLLEEQASNCDNQLSHIKRLNTSQLFTTSKEVMIDHLNETYVLRITKQNKLILTK